MAEPIPAFVDGVHSGVVERPRHHGGGYERHRPEETVLWKTLQAYWKTFLAEVESVADPPALPAFVVSEVEAFLRCGILAHATSLRAS